MTIAEPGFRERVEEIVRLIPRGRVMTYGQLAALAGSPMAARIVGGIAHFGDPDLPWQRVVNKQGGLASGYPGGCHGHAAALRAEGVTVSGDDTVDVGALLWWPSGRKMVGDAPLLVILGETASGKSALAIELAERFNGEIICADSRTVYRGMDIGTAKPPTADQTRVRHYGLDLVDPGERFTVADFKEYTLQVMADITARGKLPIIVGGSGLYIDSVIYDYEFRAPADAAKWAELRAELQGLSVEELQRRVLAQGLELPSNARNPRHLVRTLETGGRSAARSELRPNTLLLGLKVERDVLEQRITGRVDEMIEAGLVDEVRRMIERYGSATEALQAPGYKAFGGYVAGTKALDQAKSEFIRSDMRLAKRQRTWFRRNKSIHWLATDDKLAEAVDFATTFLHK